ncbi:hypothetical protein BN000_00884 [Neobacillus massiliamazoniensis]|uniref:Uncharacterized protein n=1 Tax=Neobacillus massiliamazoniensis TaxID=1499688 RepID=A0A0U1NSF1_9BACI|nr:hypothetical protein BN000_00884 [Neobacillus massiliamazoniensis]
MTGTTICTKFMIFFTFIGAEGARLLENAIALPSCVGGFKDVIQCPAGVWGRGDPAGAIAPRRLPRTARGK